MQTLPQYSPPLTDTYTKLSSDEEGKEDGEKESERKRGWERRREVSQEGGRKRRENDKCRKMSRPFAEECENLS